MCNKLSTPMIWLLVWPPLEVITCSNFIVEEFWPILLYNVASVHWGLSSLVPPQHFSWVEVLAGITPFFFYPLRCRFPGVLGIIVLLHARSDLGVNSINQRHLISSAWLLLYPLNTYESSKGALICHTWLHFGLVFVK